MDRDEGIAPQRAVGLRTGVWRGLDVRSSALIINHLSPKSLV